MSKFKVGDKIIGNKLADNHYRITVTGWIGKVLEVDLDLCIGDILVRGENFEGYVNSKYFDLYTPHQGKILIMVDEKDPNKIVARDLITGKKTEAKCNPKDEWDFEKGAKLAFSRLYPEPEKKEEKKPWTGKVICVESHGTATYCFTEGKIYDYDGRGLTDDGPISWKILGARNANDINKYFEQGYICNLSCKFIEYKGGLE